MKVDNECFCVIFFLKNYEFLSFVILEIISKIMFFSISLFFKG